MPWVSMKRSWYKFSRRSYRGVFDIKEAHVICRIMGLSPAQRVAKFSSGTGLNWLDELNCRGNETSINECAHRSIGRHDCGHNEDIGVVCTRSKLLQHSIVIILS